MLRHLKRLNYIQTNINKEDPLFYPQFATNRRPVKIKRRFFNVGKMFTHHYNTTLDFLEHEYPDFIPYVPEVFLDDPPVSG
jgi:hypothetical protein